MSSWGRGSWMPGTLGSALLALGQDEDEQGHDGQVDEVHGLDQTHDQEHGRVEPALHLGLPGDAGDGLATGQTVTDRRPDGSTAEGEATAGERPGQLDCLLSGCCHCWISPIWLTGLGDRQCSSATANS